MTQDTKIILNLGTGADSATIQGYTGPLPEPTPTVKLAFRFAYHTDAWDFMRAIDNSGGDATAGYPSYNSEPIVRVNALSYAAAWVNETAAQQGGTEVA